MNTYTPKYYQGGTGQGAPGKQGRHQDPDSWLTGPDPVQHDIYYGWLKHRSQARFRGETYNITREQWSEIWDVKTWMNRGRSPHCQMLVRVDCLGAWDINNVRIVYVRDKGQYYAAHQRAPRGKGHK